MGNCGSTANTNKKGNQTNQNQNKVNNTKGQPEDKNKTQPKVEDKNTKVEEKKIEQPKDNTNGNDNQKKEDPAKANIVEEIKADVKTEITDISNTLTYKSAVCSFNKFNKKTTKVENFSNTIVTELNYSAKQVTKFFKNQSPYTGKDAYEDDVFPPTNASIFGIDSLTGEPLDQNEDRRAEATRDFQIDADDIEWLRPAQIFGPDFAVFEGNIEFDDVRQGSIGNCYFMASISALTEVPQIIAEIFRMHEVSENGYYEVCMKIDGVWNVVILDDYIPCSKRSKKPLFANPKGNELWAILLEKAWAKVNGGYINTVAGNASEVIECLTNFPYEYNSIENADKEELWSKILKASENDYIMTTALPPRDGATEIGLVVGHEYTLQWGKEIVAEDGQTYRLLKIRNPWGSINYTGDWGKDSSLWNEEMKKIFDYKNTYDGEGEFFMAYNDFLYFFADVDICKIENRICMKQKVLSYEEIAQPNLFQFDIKEASDVTITLYKPYYRFVKSLPTDWTLTQQIFLARCTDKDNFEFTDFQGSTEGQNDCTLSTRLQPGSYYIYAFANYESAKDRDGNLLSDDVKRTLSTCVSVYSTELFDLNHVQETKMALFHKIALSYCRNQNIEEQNKLLIHSVSNFFKSEFYFIYVKSLVPKQVELTLNFSNVDLHPITTDHNPEKFLIFPQQEYVCVFSCFDMYEGHGMGYGYGYKGSKSNEKTDLLPYMSPLRNFESKANIISNYNWIYKKGDVDYKNILKKIDTSEAAFKFFKSKYPREVEEIQKVAKLPNHDELELVIQDKIDFGDGDWYFGEWRTIDGEQQMWGRGKASLSGNLFLGQFVAHTFSGQGTMILPSGDKIDGLFKEFNPHGKCTFTHNDGKVEQRTYK